jgi:hypothetical protein
MRLFRREYRPSCSMRTVSNVGSSADVNREGSEPVVDSKDRPTSPVTLCNSSSRIVTPSIMVSRQRPTVHRLRGRQVLVDLRPKIAFKDVRRGHEGLNTGIFAMHGGG